MRSKFLNYRYGSSPNGHLIYETATDQIIKDGLDLDQVRTLCRKLNFGSGFDGYTPAFFLNTFKVNLD